MRSDWNRRVRLAGFVLVLGFGSGSGLEAGAQTEAITPELVDGIFHAYREGPPRAAGIEVGMKIDKNNLDVARDLLPEPILDQLRAGNFEITVGKTTSVPPPPEYIEATKRYAGQVRLLPNGNLDYESYVAGLPFPVIREDDPLAGLKLAWNHRYYYFGETNQDWSYWKYVNKKGDVERELVADFRIMYWKHRTAFPASKSCPECDIVDERTLPHPSDMWRTDYLRFTSPFDVANFQFLQHRYEDDRIEDQNWFYLPNLRRVRRGSAAQKSDALLGTDHTLDDFNGYQGKVFHVDWEFLGERVMLVPGYTDGEKPRSGGHLGAFPYDTWELRHVLLLAGTQVDPKHPYGRRLIVLDKQTMGIILMSFAWDRKDQLWKIWFLQWGDPNSSSPECNRGNHAPVLNGLNVIDIQRDHATVVPIDNCYLVGSDLAHPDIFQVQYLRQGH